MPRKKSKAEDDDDDMEDDDEEEFDPDAEELEDEELDDADEEEAGPSSKAKGSKKKGAAAASTKRSRGRGSKLIDEDAEEDEEEAGGSRRKKRSMFIDDIADVDDEDDEEEPDEEAEEGLIDDRDVEVDREAAAAGGHQANYRLLSRDQDEKTEEELARYIEDRYKQYDERGDDDAAGDAGTVGQQGLLPSINDPKLWMVQCRPGREREACIQLLQKYYTLAERGTPLLIKSAVALDHLKGFVYVEAEKEANVRDAIRGLRTMFSSKGVRLVPLNEMVDAISVNKKAKLNIARDNWVRVRGGLYKDDLARVVDVDFAAQRVVIRLLPRLDLNAMATRDENEKRVPFGRQPVVRPPAKPFNADEARQLGLPAIRKQSVEGQVMVEMGTHRFINGYIERTVAVKSLMVLEAHPPLDELAKFNSAAASQDTDPAHHGDLSSLMAALPTDTSALPKAKFAKGDKVVFLSGELKNLDATVVDVRDDGKVMVVPRIDGFDEAIDCNPDELRKFFMVGDRVKVINGQHSGESGMLLHIMSNDLCVIISDTSREELKVFSRDLTHHSEADTGVESLGEYQLHDLVQLDQSLAGVIIKIEKQTAQLVTSESTLEKPDIRVCRVTDMQRKVRGKNIITTDKLGNKISCNDFVTIVDGPAHMKGKGGAVEYIWRGTLFIKCRELADVSGGFLSVRARACSVRGGVAKATDAVAGGMGQTPRQTPQSPAHGGGGGGARPGYAPQSPIASGLRGAELRPPPPRMAMGGSQGPHGGGGFGGGGGHGGGGSRLSGVLLGKTVRIIAGAYKGYRGRVKQESETLVQVELDALNKVGTVKIELVRIEGAAGSGVGGPSGSYGAPQPRSGFGGGYGSGPSGGFGSSQHSSLQGTGFGRHAAGAGPSTQASAALPYGARTPMHHYGTGSATPLHPSMTPGYAPYTPAHQAATPMDDNYNYGPSTTGGWGDTGRDGPSGGGGYRDHQYRDQGMDSQAGAHSQGAGASGHLPVMSAPTPGLHHAYTPGGAAHTPALTPGYGHETAPTPGLPDHQGDPPAHAPTPAIASTPGLAPTPYVPGVAPTPALTPGLDTAPTPGGGGYGYTPATGLTPGLAPTPGMPAITPAFTPGVGGFPGTPGMDIASTPGPGGVDSFAHWPGVLVTLPRSEGRTAVVRGVAHDGRSLFVQPGVVDPSSGTFVADGGAPEQSVDGMQLALVPPLKKDRVKVLGETAETGTATAAPGSAGTLIGIDGTDGIVKVDNTTDLMIIDMRLLGKLVAQ